MCHMILILRHDVFIFNHAEFCFLVQLLIQKSYYNILYSCGPFKSFFCKFTKFFSASCSVTKKLQWYEIFQSNIVMVDLKYKCIPYSETCLGRPFVLAINNMQSFKKGYLSKQVWFIQILKHCDILVHTIK